MKTNDGKSLEQLVKLIEGALIPRGFSIESRERVYNDDGVQIAEFDIVITGKLGSAPLKWLIECRDRPSDGAAPGEWIEQLVGRRSRFNFGMVMAVSTTGFAEGAIEEAKRAGIEIRTMDSLTTESVLSWIPNNAPLVVRRGDYDGVQFYLDDVTEEELRDLKSKFTPRTPLIIDTESGETISMDEFWTRALDRNPQLFDGIALNDEPKSASVRVACEGDRYKIKIGERLVRIAEVHVSAILSIRIPQMPLTEVYQYSRLEGELIAQVTKWEGQPDDLIKGLTFIGFPKTDKSVRG
jgi:hypothetical protein